jgi:hypothetical protein
MRRAVQLPTPSTLPPSELSFRSRHPKKRFNKVRINGLFNFGDNPQASFIRNNLTFADDVSWVAGKHDLKFGGVYERSKVDLLNGFFQPAEFSFSSPANFLAGKLTDYSGNLAFRQGAW